MIVYLDNNVLNRPFDDQSQPRIWLETVSFVLVLTLIEAGECDFVRSPINYLENGRCREEARVAWVERCLRLATKRVKLSETIRKRASALEALGVSALDALHAACAEAGMASHLLTCDDKLIRRYSGSLRVMTPTAFIESLRELQ